MQQILPLAITMMAGPQIIAAIILLTGRRPVQASLGYITGVAIASTAGTLLFAGLAGHVALLGPDTGRHATTIRIIQTILIALLMVAVIKTYLNRATTTLPPWVSRLRTASGMEALELGLKLILLMPSDIAIMATVGLALAGKSNTSVQLAPFIAATVVIAALPLLAYLLFRRQALQAMPKVTAWMEHNSWIISVTTYLIFIVLLWS